MNFMIGLLIITGMYTGSFEFNPEIVHLIEYGDTTKIRIPGWEITDEVGAPEIPMTIVRVALPYGAIIKNIQTISTTSRELKLTHNISFARPPYILSKEIVVDNSQPDMSIYHCDKPYPEKIVELKGLGIIDSIQICELRIVPFHYYPVSKRLIVYNSIKYAISYEAGSVPRAKNFPVEKLVENLYDIIRSPKTDVRNQIRYLIITNPPMDTIFQRLADWKTKKGIPASVRNINWILSHYPGEDSAAKIRNYLKILSDSSTEYVLLGGDVDIVPCRFAYAMTCSAGFSPGREDTMPCDLYYADLQGTWDRDGDGSYGEVEDSIDLYPDLFIGRAPVNTIQEAQRFVNKVLIYEKNPVLDYLDNALFAAEILWSDPYTDQGVHKNKIGDESIPDYFEITKLYQSLGNETKQSVMQAIRQGQNLINHDGHGWIDLISVGGWPHRIYCVDFDTITNTPKYGILYSIGCWTAAFDYESVSEAFVNSPNGGGVAYIGNSSYGWGSPGNPGFGYSDRFDSRFFHSLFVQKNFRLGVTLALAKAHFIPYSREENVYRWHQYQINLLGDPEMPVWTKIPDTLLVFHPQTIPVGTARVMITVKSKHTNLPIRNALVCLRKDNESYSTGYTDASGTIFLNTTATNTGNFELTITAHNFLPFEDTIPVISGPYINYTGWTINDIFGNNDNIANPGENILLPTRIVNCGNAVAESIKLVLTIDDTLTLVLDSLAFVSSLPAGDSAIIDNAFAVSVRNTAINGNCVECELKLIYNNITQIFKPTILIGTPIIKVENTSVTTLPVLPGEIESLYIDLKNYGFGAGHSSRAHLQSIDPYAFVLIDSVRYGEISPESLKMATEPFVIYISPFSPSAHISKFLLYVTTESYVFTDTLSVLVGETGFSDDMESGSSLWTTGGINNFWHISTRRSFSPSHSWYCGNESSGQYINNMNCYIQTVPFMIQKNSLLKFYRWFRVPIYGSDGIYVIVLHDNQADTLDFIGTGGALEKRPIQSNWFEEKYLLAGYSAGDTIQIRIAFISDNDGAVSEGFYIDNVNVEYLTTIQEEKQDRNIKPQLEIHPNPFRNHLVIKFQIPNTKFQTNSNSQIPNNSEFRNPKSEISLKVYDATGRMVKDLTQLLNYQLPNNFVVWSGTDDAGRPLPAGVYFIRLTAVNHQEIKKIILLK